MEIIKKPTQKYKQQIINRALNYIREEATTSSNFFTDAEYTKNFVTMRIADDHQEKFLVLYLNSQNRLIKDIIEFKGTINSAAVYPREIVRNAITLGASAIIVAHNHPSGVAEPSQADINITERIKSALKLIDVNLLDHFVVGRNQSVSFAQRGLL
jgi:DNA repair protein RadC